MNKPQRSAFNFKLSPVAASVVFAMTQLATGVVHAGSGYGAGNYIANPAVTVPVPTFYANSPAGPVLNLLPGQGAVTIDPNTKLPLISDSGKALRKFVDTLPGFPGLNASGFLGGANNLGQVIPTAVPEKWVDSNGNVTGDDYYEIAAIEFAEKMHSDLVKPTHLRGYVQLSTLKNPGAHIQLFYPDGVTPILDSGKNPVYAFAAPHHLGPFINAVSGTPVRVKFTNYLPYTDAAGNSVGSVNGTGGNLFLPVDKTVTGAGMSADGKHAYTENRAEIHLVGAQSPWISAGSPHQWVAPAGEATAYANGLGKGPSNQDVPDMLPAGPGSTTLYFPNAQSARLSFFHDRTSGLTRLNTYAGLEAAYMITDAAEQSLVASGAIPADQIPLILEDKTFVPNNVAQQDAKWDTAHWGAPGDLWFPHVYETNQDPNAINATNPVGRWDFGPWFWPIFPATQALPTGEYGKASFTPEAYQDTPLVNGTAYPTLTVDPKAYRFRILNASNDRYFNLGWYKADTTVVAPQLDSNGYPMYDAINGTPLYITNTEVKMVPALGDVTGAPLNPVSSTVPYDPACLCQYPNLQQLLPMIQFSGPNRAWPVDARVGGAPDPTAVGPDFISIGTDGGLLPNPVDVPSQPITYEANRRSVTVGNVYGYGLLVGPSERADTVVDFSAYGGQTLILYNDAPTPFPFNDQRVDYFTGGPDQTLAGGAYSTQPGYGPNTRTVMQVKVNMAAVPETGKFVADNLNTALPIAYAASQPTPIVPQSTYNAAFGTHDSDNYAHVATGSVAQPTLDFTSTGTLVIDRVDLISSGGQLIVGTNNIVGNNNPGSGQGYDPKSPPNVVFNNGKCLSGTGTTAAAHAVVDAVSHQITSVILDTAGAGYTCAPQVTFESLSGVGAQATVHTATTQSILVQTKAEQELFDAAGRYNSTGGVELPLTSGTTQTTVPLSYIDAPTEFIGDGEVQLWKIVDNGFWTNSMHFDFVDVQLINRVGWDGTLKPPASNEVGWKDTLRLNPLEDVVVAMRAKRAVVPFGLPASTRSLDPSVPVGRNGSNLGFLADPNVTSPTGTPLLTNTVNMTQNFDNEFVWNSAVLGHSEDDLMRPMVFHPTVTAPPAPSGIAGSNGLLTWVDATPAGAPGTIANAASEVGFYVSRATYSTTTQAFGGYTKLATLPANTVSYTDTSQVLGRAYSYTVSAWNAAGTAVSAPWIEIHTPAAPAFYNPSITSSNGAVSLSWNTVTGATGYLLSINGAAPISVTGNSYNLSAAQMPVGGVYSVTVASQVVVGSNSASSAPSAPITVDLSVPAPLGSPVVASTVNSSGRVSLTWPAITGAANYQVAINGGTPVVVTGTSYTVPSASMPIGAAYTVTVQAAYTKYGVTATTPATSVPVDLVAAVAPAAPTGVQAVLTNGTTATLNWNASTGATGYVVQVKTNGGNFVTLAPVVTGTSLTYTVAVGNTYTFQVAAQTVKNVSNYTTTANSAYTASAVLQDAPAAVGVPAFTASVSPTSGTVTMNWTGVTGASSYLVSINGAPGITVTGTSYRPTLALGSSYTLAMASQVTVNGLTTPSAYSAAQTVDLSTPTPAVPTGFALGTQTTNTATLSWSAVTGATGYVVSRSVNGGTSSVVSTITNGATSYNATISSGNSYAYQVAAQQTTFGVTKVSAASSVVNVATPVTAPTGMTAVSGGVGSKAITVSWTDGAANLTGFTVTRSTAGGAYASITPTISGTGTYSFTDSGLVAGTRYTYRVVANGGSASSTATTSQQVTAQ